MNGLEAPLAIVDLETTGSRPAWDRITEIGVIEVDGFQVVSEWGSNVIHAKPASSERRNMMKRRRIEM